MLDSLKRSWGNFGGQDRLGPWASIPLLKIDLLQLGYGNSEMVGLGRVATITAPL
jgi:hypothetical protein